jgi:hypothetical protein
MPDALDLVSRPAGNLPVFEYEQKLRPHPTNFGSVRADQSLAAPSRGLAQRLEQGFGAT